MNSCCDLGYFSFEKNFYLQLDGTSMGGPASPALTNFVMHHEDYHADNLERVREILLNNNYPGGFVNLCIERFKQNQNRVRAAESKYYFEFPYIRGLSSHISRVFIGTKWRPETTTSKLLAVCIPS
ncbi:Protein of unknown function [Cotesia congregata]|uniref:Uncharacterized protein n=1 Tax=Cotesia congregata TaxID=51543 RepID=A0A8J2H198_COTCN|nr:Protein of unknown function [Cotesia congregata]